MPGTAHTAMSVDMADAAGGMAAFDLQSMTYSSHGGLQECAVRVFSAVCVTAPIQHGNNPLRTF